ncbi:hypothetical protein BDY17DRAFT_321315 [Neohortaea acidophila]|uniref:Uncharacterized protein n=1 Tax=Neohortaea acidophila TaxID=245834 RepID=A0A6A6Q3D6_9PEZI|nr:uncharacterized protein BDY17DRAFT_321315 [Neohortaea acidophila]KAF2486529.1 hypothetical protein BDY17DRAFT_321315 [Neohortaea acidophila]
MAALGLDLNQQDLIANGWDDIATSIHGEQMRVEADGRKPLQFVYLRTEPDKGKVRKGKSQTATTNITYDPVEDRPAGMTITKLPDPRELVEGDETYRYLEVGIIIGNQPDKYTPTGQPRDKKRESDRAARGPLRRDPTAMRVFIPETESVAPQARFYVGVRPVNGHLLPRVIPNTNIFFYQEFRHGFTAKMTLREQKRVVLTRIREQAARDKTGAAVNDDMGADDDDSELQPSKEGQPGPNFGHTLQSFCNYDENFSKEEAMHLVEAFGLADSTDDKNAMLRVLAIHDEICANGLGYLIPYKSARFFIRTCIRMLPIDRVESDTLPAIQLALGVLADFNKENANR